MIIKTLLVGLVMTILLSCRTTATVADDNEQVSYMIVVAAADINRIIEACAVFELTGVETINQTDHGENFFSPGFLYSNPVLRVRLTFKTVNSGAFQETMNRLYRMPGVVSVSINNYTGMK